MTLEFDPREAEALVRRWRRDHPQAEPSANGHAAKENDKSACKSAATRLIELAEADGVELYHTAEQTAFADFQAAGRRETLPVRGTAFRRWLARLLYEAEGRAAGGQAVQDAIGVIEGRACFDGAERAVSVRIAEFGDKIYLDLADEKWRAAEIDAAGWRIIAEPPVRFRRPKGLRPLPAPVAGGSLDDLRAYVNLPDDAAWRLLAAWMVAALRPCGPYPVLCLHGQQGCAKSTLARVIRALIDPNAASLRSEPREARDLMIAANSGWIIALDNLSHLPAWLSDALCRLATGGGFATRELYTDSEEFIFDAQRPVILTGIEDLATRGDLLDRAILINLPPIPEPQRRAEREFWARFTAARPRLLGALLTAVSGAMRELPNVHLDQLPRMADFAEWAVAAERAMMKPAGSFLTAYGANRADAHQAALEASPIVPFVLKFVEARGEWTGTASHLLAELDRLAGEAEAKKRDWPRNGRSLSGRLKRLAPNLHQIGISVDFQRDTRRRLIHLENIRDFASFASLRHPHAENTEKTSDFRHDANHEAKPTHDANRAGDDANMTQTPSENQRKNKRNDANDANDAKSRTFSYLAPGVTPEDALTPFDEEGAP